MLKITSKRLFYLFLVLLLLPIHLVSAQSEASVVLSESDAAVYKDYAEENCINILVAGSNQAPIYNGEVAEIGLVPPYISDAHIAADSLGYLRIEDIEDSPFMDVIFDGKNYGTTTENTELIADPNFVVGDQRFAYIRLESTTELDSGYQDGQYRLIVDGEDWGETHYGSFLNADEGSILYSKYVDDVSYIFVDGEQKREGYSAMLDGEDLWVVNQGELYKNDQFVMNLGAGGSYIGDFYAQDGHLIYSKGVHSSLADIYYDDELLGRGTHPVVEGSHFAYLWTPEDDNFEYHFIYDGDDKGVMHNVQKSWHTELQQRQNLLAGEHFAFIQEINGELRVNIDGIQFPGDFPDGTYVEITQRPGCMPEGWPFTDVSPTNVYNEAISGLKDSGIIVGYSDGSYGPNKSINRAEFLKIVVESFYEIETDEYAKSCFEDVKSTDWFAPYVCFAQENSIVAGYDDGTFRPAQNINRVEALKIVLESSFESIEEAEGQWYTKYFVKAAAESLLSSPLNDWEQEPGELVTRGDMAELVYRLMVP